MSWFKFKNQRERVENVHLKPIYYTFSARNLTNIASRLATEMLQKYKTWPI